MTRECSRAEVAAALHAHLCECSKHGYTQGAGRNGSGEPCGVNVNGECLTVRGGDRDCSSSVCDCWQVALEGTRYEGSLDGATYTGDMRAAFLASGLFTWEPMTFTAQRGDIYLNESDHAAMCQTAQPDVLSEFCIDENGGIIGGEVGDQTGGESRIRGYYAYPWDGILHYNGKADFDMIDEIDVERIAERVIQKLTQEGRQDIGQAVWGYINPSMNAVDVYQLITDNHNKLCG